MKKILLINFFLFLVASCIQDSDSTDPPKTDAKTNTLKQEQIRRDSLQSIRLEKKRIAKMEKDSINSVEEKKVIGPINFGITKSEFNKQYDKFKKTTVKDREVANVTLTDYFIGEYQYGTIHDMYDDDKLHSVIIRGYPILFEYYDTKAPQQVYKIKEVISKKYSDPIMSRPIKKRYELNSGYSVLVEKWEVGNKEIEIRVSSSGSSYGVDVHIFRSDVINKIEKQKLEDSNEDLEKAKDVF